MLVRMLSENVRALISTLIALAVTVPLAWTLSGGELVPMDFVVLFLSAYLIVHLTLTVTVFTRTKPAEIRAWARRNGRGTWWQRYVAGTAPGPGSSIGFGLASLLVAVFWIPRGADVDSQLPLSVRIGAGIAMVVLSWLAIALSFAVAYHADDLLEPGGLDFPGKGSTTWSDYVYFSVMVSTTFGTTDVDVTTSALRRTLTVHGLLAFAFNTIILAALVGVVV